jgi:hypothetical protein
VPGIAHVFAMWGFIVLTLTIIEVFGALVWADFGIPVIGQWPVIGFIEDLFAVLVVVGIVTFAIIRLRHNPAKQGRYSRFFGSHTGAAWIVLAGIFTVVWTLLLYRAAQINTGVFPFDSGAFASEWLAGILEPSASGWLETVASG